MMDTPAYTVRLTGCTHTPLKRSSKLVTLKRIACGSIECLPHAVSTVGQRVLECVQVWTDTMGTKPNWCGCCNGCIVGIGNTAGATCWLDTGGDAEDDDCLLSCRGLCTHTHTAWGTHTQGKPSVLLGWYVAPARGSAWVWAGIHANHYRSLRVAWHNGPVTSGCIERTRNAAMPLLTQARAVPAARV